MFGDDAKEAIISNRIKVNYVYCMIRSHIIVNIPGLEKYVFFRRIFTSLTYPSAVYF